MSVEARTNYDETQILKGKLTRIPPIDQTLTKAGHCADAKVTGDKINSLTRRLDDVDPHGASNIDYTNTTSGLTATNVQSAIDEVNTLLRTLGTNLTALSNDALRKSASGMMKGTFMVQNADNGYGSIMKNNSETADYGTQLADVSKSGNTAKITVNALSNLLTFTDSSGNIRNVMHEGNKRFGIYSGNGSATSRVIEMNSIGRLALVYNTKHFSFVTPEGAMVIDLTNGAIDWIEGGKVFYINGKLTLLLTNVAFNENGTTYYYQAI
jgi:hypothetical protein